MSTRKDLPIHPFLRRFWPVLVLVLLPLIPLYQAVFLGEAIGPFDQIRQMAPWNGPKPAQPWDVLQADGVLQFYVWRDLVFDAWGKGQMPFWNSFQLAGTPLLANSQSGALYPPHMLFGILHVPTATAMMLLAWFHLFWAGLGAYVLCRAVGANRVGGFVGGASFSLSSFMIAWTGLPSVIETVSWIPWVLALTVLLFERNPLLVRLQTFDPGRAQKDAVNYLSEQFAVMRNYSVITFALGISIGMMILAGHLQFVAYGFLAEGLLFVWLWATRPNVMKGLEVASLTITTHRHQKKSVADMLIEQPPDGMNEKARPASARMNPKFSSALQLVFATILGVCIAAPQLLPVLNYSQFSHRKNAPTNAGYDSYVGNAIRPYELVKMIVPSMQGNPRQMASDQLPISTYYPAILKPGANFAESALGIGVLALILLCFLPLVAKLKEPVWGVLLGGGVGFLLAMGTPLDRLLYFAVPGWSSTGSPGRAICLFVLASSVGMGVAASKLGPLRDSLQANARRIGFAAVGFVVICTICALTKNAYELRPGLNAEVIDSLKDQAESSARSSGLGITLLSLLAIGLALKEESIRSKVALMCIPILSCLAFFGTTLIQTGKPDLAIKNSTGMERIAPINKPWDIFQAAHATVPPNLSALNRIHSLDGYDSLMHRDSVALLSDIDGKDAATEVNGNMMLIKPSANWKKLAEAGVTQVWSQDRISELEDSPGTSVAKQDDGLYKYKLNGPGRASTDEGPVPILSETPSQLKLRATGPGKLIVRERNMPGWVPKVDGKHVPIGGTTWMEIDLPPGDHQVELNYVPPGFMNGLFLAAVGWAIAAILAVRILLFSRQTRNLLAPGSK